MTKTILLSQGKMALVDDEQFERLNQHKWHYQSSGYAARASKTEKGWWPRRMHRDILGLQGSEIGDHINCDKLDNRTSNLRRCNAAENARNRGLNRNNSSGYKGVHYNRAREVYQAYITVNRRHIYLGAFDCPKEAARAYNAAALEHFGEFARLNEIERQAPPAGE